MKLLEYMYHVANRGKHTHPIAEEQTIKRWMLDMLHGDSDAFVKVYLLAYLTEPSTLQLTLVNDCRIALQHVENIFINKEYMNESKATIKNLLEDDVGQPAPEARSQLPEGVRLIEGSPETQGNTSLPPGGNSVHRSKGVGG